ncbi:hypothetical protein B5M43_012490 [Microbacterium sp. MEC084]|uniref:hypothetical protein n=1 Tax=Microbacterium sp. MEC084 TaxID=1963027 RepID=UPI00107008BB|nr:hypothetical protein [Microbacterium sp. MEC084]MCD1269643.1 hypothetical protein [Microbacterium sp. MEC084]
MEILTLSGAALLAAILGGAVMWRLRERRRARDAVRDDTLRAGTAPEQSREAAALRAEGRSSWMRPTF